MAYRRGPNNLLRAARLALRSPSGSGRPMSRQELADAVNAHAHAGCRSAVDARYIGKLERGEHRWPFEPYRTALREVLGKATSADLGFFIVKGHAQDLEVSAEEPGPDGSWTSSAPGADPGRRVSVAATAGPVMVARAAVRVTVSVHAETVTALVRHDDATGGVVVLAGPVEVMIEPSDVSRGRLVAVSGVPSTGAGLRQVYRLPDRRCR